MFQRHRVATIVGAIGVAIILAHGMLGREVVPVAGALIGLIVAGGAGLWIVIADRKGSDRSEDARE